MKRTSEEYILMTLSFGGAIAISPFAIIRIANAEWIIGVVDLILVTGMLALGTYVYLSQQVKLAKGVLSILCLAGTVLVVYIKGYSLLYWTYPTMVSAFYLLTPRTAALLSTILIFTLVPVLIRDMDIMVFIAAMITLVTTIVFAYVFASRMHMQSEQLSLLIRKDPLTGTGNRRALEEKLEEYTASQQRTKIVASLLMLDLDHFKNINDVYGHIVGDQVLVKLTEVINSRIRISDNLFRFGGEEFVIIALGTSASSAETLAEDLRELIELATLLPNAVTISIGVAEYEEGETGESWIQRCDKALYEAKSMGRNRVCVTT